MKGQANMEGSGTEPRETDQIDGLHFRKEIERSSRVLYNTKYLIRVSPPLPPHSLETSEKQRFQSESFYPIAQCPTKLEKSPIFPKTL